MAEPLLEPHPEPLLVNADWLRVCRDIAWSEIAAMPGGTGRLGPRVTSPDAAALDWGSNGLDLDSLARMQMATAAATWCNAYDSGFEDLFLAKRSIADWAIAMRRARAAGSRHFTFSTSGSTGARKHIRHREDLLAGEAAAWQTVLQADAPTSDCPIRRVVVLASTHHIYGFIWGVLLPRVLGVPVIDADLTALPALEAGDLIVAVPDQWAWLASGGGRAWPPGVVGISSTAPLPADVHRMLTAGSPQPALSRLLQIYGSSETAGLAYRTAPEAPYRLAPGRLRHAGDGIALELGGGELAPMAVQDALEWVSDITFNLRGRSDASVQVAGHNVSPEWVRQQLLTHPAVLEASVRLSSTLTPPRLKAFIVLKTSADGAARHQLQQLAAWATQQLPWYAAPARFDYGAELPRNAMGKASDWPERY